MHSQISSSVWLVLGTDLISRRSNHDCSPRQRRTGCVNIRVRASSKEWTWQYAAHLTLARRGRASRVLTKLEINGDRRYYVLTANMHGTLLRLKFHDVFVHVHSIHVHAARTIYLYERTCLKTWKYTNMTAIHMPWYHTLVRHGH